MDGLIGVFLGVAVGAQILTPILLFLILNRIDRRK